MRNMDEMLAVDRVSVAFPGRQVLTDVSFTLERGAFCGLIGSNGSGKTTLLRTILGFQTPGAGDIRIDSVPRSGAAGTVGYVPQKIQFDPDVPLRARDLVELGLTGHRLGLPWPSKARARLVDEMLAAVDAQGFADQRVGNLSGGQQQRVLIAHALIRQPKLLLLDEPLANLDLAHQQEAVALVARVCRTRGVTVMLVAHDINPLLSVTDRVIYIARGRSAIGKPETVINSRSLSQLYGSPVEVVQSQDRYFVLGAEV